MMFDGKLTLLVHLCEYFVLLGWGHGAVKKSSQEPGS